MEPINKNWTNKDGTHAGGQSTGIGFAIAWQRGEMNVEGRNGAFVIDVLEAALAQIKYFQDAGEGRFWCSENEEAIHHLYMALEYLKARRDRRAAEGTLGTHEAEVKA